MADNCGIDILILILIVLFTIFLMTFILNNKIEKEKELYQNDWAIYNYGQQIENKSGIAGIDINIRPIFNKINTKKDDYVIVAVVDTGVDLSNSIMMTIKTGLLMTITGGTFSIIITSFMKMLYMIITEHMWHQPY